MNALYPALQNAENDNKEQQDYIFVPRDGMILKFGQFGGTLTDFHKPYSLAVGQNGQYAISERSGSRILVFSNTGILLSRITCLRKFGERNRFSPDPLLPNLVENFI
jgi:hypothetical protein